MTDLRSLSLSLFLTVSSVATATAQGVTCQRPAPTRALLESFAMNTHMQQGWQYSDAPRTVALLKELGVRQLREAFTGLGHPSLEYAAREGMKFVFFISSEWGGKVISALEDWEKRYPGSIIAIEGPNEVNNWPVEFEGLKGIPAAQKFQAWLYDGVHASPVLRNIPVLALTSWPVFPNKSDIGNIHAYSRSGDFLTEALDSALKDERTLNPPAKRTWMTEAGYHTHLGQDHDEGVSENVQAKMLTTAYLEAFAKGVEKTFLYQLLDQYTDPNDQQSYFGLVTLEWRRKPAFDALKAMIEIVGSGAAAKDGPQKPLAFALEGAPFTSSRMLLQEPNGDWIVAVWDQPRIWDADRNLEIENPPSSVTLRLAQPAARLALYDPLTGSAPVDAKADASAIEFKLDDHPIFIRIKAGASVAACSPDGKP